VIVWKWTLIATALFVAYLLWQCGSGLYQGGRLANGSVHHFHQELNSGQYDQIWQEGDSGFREGGKHEEFVRVLQATHAKLGNATTENLTNLHVNATTGGTLIITSYNTTFSGGMAEETFTWVKEGSGLKLRRYVITSPAFLP
jgi:hypothetical protein